ncbi:hypothetical protein HYDPIDRAFT_24370 [Hydnomerulius pinastri MD-312]|nr:hypothetical protein HYDPIDRAFT_24370 [Hydnomerulius pinastri MD-312]
MGHGHIKASPIHPPSPPTHSGPAITTKDSRGTKPNHSRSTHASPAPNPIPQTRTAQDGGAHARSHRPSLHRMSHLDVRHLDAVMGGTDATKGRIKSDTSGIVWRSAVSRYLPRHSPLCFVSFGALHLLRSAPSPPARLIRGRTTEVAAQASRSEPEPAALESESLLPLPKEGQLQRMKGPVQDVRLASVLDESRRAG